MDLSNSFSLFQFKSTYVKGHLKNCPCKKPHKNAKTSCQIAQKIDTKSLKPNTVFGFDFPILCKNKVVQIRLLVSDSTSYTYKFKAKRPKV